MRRFRIGSPFGVPVTLDLTFLVVLPAFAYVIGARVGTTAGLLDGVTDAGLAVDALTGGLTPWLLGTAAAVGLFVGVLAHEFGHSLVARYYGHDVESITLWIFGGVAKLSRLPEDWHEELAIAVAGPAVSVAVGAFCYGLALAVPTGLDGVRYVLLYLAVLNVGLAAFNLLPAFPMDGGRVLRALLGRTRSFARATRIAAAVGRILAVLLGFLGLAWLNPILIGAAVFVFVAASSEARRVVTRAALEGVTVDDVMTPVDQLDVVAPDASVQALRERMRHEERAGYPVVGDGTPLGVVTREDVRAACDHERVAPTVDDVVTNDVATIGPDDEATTALSRMSEHDVGQLLVVHEDHLVGLVSRTDLTTALDVLRRGGDLSEASAATGHPDPVR